MNDHSSSPQALHIPKDPEYNQDYQHAIRLMHTKLIVDIDDMISTIVDIGKRHIQKYFSHNVMILSLVFFFFFFTHYVLVCQ